MRLQHYACLKCLWILLPVHFALRLSVSPQPLPRIPLYGPSEAPGKAADSLAPWPWSRGLTVSSPQAS